MFEEGCAELDPFSLLENRVHHNLVWLNRWLDEGVEPVHAQWRNLVKSIGENIKINGQEGIFLGVDNRFGLLLRAGEVTHLLPSVNLFGKGPIPMKLARTIHFDESDQHVFPLPTRTEEWAISGGFEFSNWIEADLAGKAKQAFTNGWLGLGNLWSGNLCCGHADRTEGIRFTRV